MFRHSRIHIYCTLSFFLGCTFTLCVIKYDDCSDICGSRVAEHVKLPRENDVGNGNENSMASQLGKTIHSFLIVMIMSSPSNEEQRNSIRETWATYAYGDDVRYFFLIGSKNLTNDQSAVLVKEYEKNKDLVLLAEAVDTYEGLTSKVLLSFSWLTKVADYSFMLKCDDDTFVRIPLVLKELKDSVRETHRKRLYWGYFDGRAHVHRRGKWAEPKWVICDRYLPYALGGGYVLSKELVNIIVDRGPHLELYRNEDVSVGAWLATVKDLERRHDPRFDTEHVSRGCMEDYIVTHKVSPSVMKTLFASLKTAGKLCPSGEIRVRNSYVYDWNVPPSRCCARSDSSIP